jgi:LysR family glycine cleavage system transcriptional activator
VFFPACAPTLNGGVLPQTPADLANVQLLRSDELWRPWFETAGIQQFGEPLGGVRYLDSSNLLQAAIEGQGVALVRRSIAMHDIAAGHLLRLFDIDATSPASYFFVCPPPLVASPRVQAFHSWIFEEAKRFRALYARTCSRMG